MQNKVIKAVNTAFNLLGGVSINKNNLGIKITSVILATLTPLTMAGCSIKKDKNITGRVVTIPIEEYQDNNEYIGSFSRYNGNSSITYDQLIEKFESNIAHFDKSIQDILRENFNEMLLNGDKLSKVFKNCGFPSKEVFINEVFVEKLKDIKFIKILDNEKDYKLMQKYNTSYYVPEEKGIYVSTPFNDKNTINKIIKEESIHSGQEKLLNDDVTYYTYCIFGEGEANLLSCSLTDACISSTSSYSFYEQNNNIYSNYGLGNGYYTFATKYYVYLMSLLGYEEMIEFKNKPDVNKLTENLSRIYGINGAKFYDDMEWIIARSSIDELEDEKSRLVSIENTYWECMNKRLSSITKKEDMESFLELYRYINTQFRFEYLICKEEKNGNFIYDIKTDEKVSKKEFEDKIFEKTKGFGILGSVINNKDGRQLFDALMMPKLDENQNIYPITILDSAINYNPDAFELTVSNPTFSYTTNIVTFETQKISNSVENSLNK